MQPAACIACPAHASACTSPSFIPACLVVHGAAGSKPALLVKSSHVKSVQAKSRLPLARRFVLLKERTRLHAEKQLYRSRGDRMPDPSRIGKVRKSMARIKHVRPALEHCLPLPRLH